MASSTPYSGKCFSLNLSLHDAEISIPLIELIAGDEHYEKIIFLMVFMCFIMPELGWSRIRLKIWGWLYPPSEDIGTKM
jgi:hypothetical protein